MFYVVLILLLLAAIFGILGAVLKVTAILVISIVLALCILAAIGWWMVKRKARTYQVEIERRLPGGPGDAGAGSPGSSA